MKTVPKTAQEMKNSTTAEKNALIAKYMGMRENKGSFLNEQFPDHYRNIRTQVDHTENFILVKSGEKQLLFQPQDLRFNQSWDWLIPVIEKMQSEPLTADEFNFLPSLTIGSVVIEELFDQSAAFIQFLNKKELRATAEKKYKELCTLLSYHEGAMDANTESKAKNDLDCLDVIWLEQAPDGDNQHRIKATTSEGETWDDQEAIDFMDNTLAALKSLPKPIEYNWAVPTRSFYGSFDSGKVIATNEEEARDKAWDALQKNLNQMQDALNNEENGHSIDYDGSKECLEITTTEKSE